MSGNICNVTDVDESLPPLCDMCGTLERMRTAGTVERPYWRCPVCGAARILPEPPSD